jgi:hypothetical protein
LSDLIVLGSESGVYGDFVWARRAFRCTAKDDGFRPRAGGAVLLKFSSAFVKQPRGGAATPWHQARSIPAPSGFVS